MKYLIVLIFSFININIYCCSNSDPVIDCNSASPTYAVLFMQYLTNKQKDSLDILFKNWQSSCGMCEPLQRARIISALKYNMFNDSILGDSIACNIMTFLDRKKNNYFGNERYYSFIPINGDFDNYTRLTARALMANYPEKSVEHLLCELYANISGSILINIKNPTYRNSKIYKNPCSSKVKQTKKLNGLNKEGIDVAFMSGAWIPTRGLSKLGVHPELGFQIGEKRLDNSLQLTLVIKFLKTPNKYLARRIHTTDSLEYTDYFVGPYIGLDYGRSIIKSNKSEVQLLAGLGFDAFSVLKENKDKNQGYEDVRSYNINFGLGYKYYFKNSTYIGIEPKYNIVDYTLNRAIDLKGNFISIRFMYGYLEKLKKNKEK